MPRQRLRSIPNRFSLITSRSSNHEGAKGNQPGPFSDLDKDHMRRLWDRTRAQLPQIEDAVHGHERGSPVGPEEAQGPLGHQDDGAVRRVRGQRCLRHGTGCAQRPTQDETS